MDGDNKISLDRGVVTVVDNQVDQTTGTIKLKAEFPNAALQLWPGQFVNLRVLADTLKQVTVLPTPAIQRGPTGIYVFVATADNKVTQRPVTIGLQSDTQSVVLTGVTAGERVVTTGFARLQDGGRIWISPSATGEAAKPAPSAAPGSGAPEASAAPAAAGERQKGEGKGGKRRDGEGKRPPASAEAKGAAPAAQGSPQ